MPQLAILMLWCMPALHYWLDAAYPGIMITPMAVPAEVYFPLALPGVFAICIAWFLPLPGIPDRELLRERLVAVISHWGADIRINGVLAFLVLFGYYGAPVVLPGAFQFLGAVLRSLLYLLFIIPLFNRDMPGRWVVWSGASALLIYELLHSSMFGDLVGLLVILLFYGVFIRQWRVGRLLVLQLVFGALLYWLISFKYEYRRFVSGHPDFSARVGYFLQSGAQHLQHPVSPKIIDVVVSRLNQGQIMSQIFAYVPAKQSFVNGETIKNACLGAFVPRLFWPDKPKAGGVENIRRFMGIEGLHYSINLGIVGEAYVNYGARYLFWLSLMCYVLFFRILYVILLHYSAGAPYLLLLLPLVFFIVNFVEKDFGIALNHVVKVLGLLVVFFTTGAHRGAQRFFNHLKGT